MYFLPQKVCPAEALRSARFAGNCDGLIGFVNIRLCANLSPSSSRWQDSSRGHTISDGILLTKPRLSGNCHFSRLNLENPVHPSKFQNLPYRRLRAQERSEEHTSELQS